MPQADGNAAATYALAPKHALAQLAATGCFGNTYYATAETQLDELRKLIDQVDDNVYLAKLAVYARERAYMKDMPALLCAILAVQGPGLLKRIFHRVIDNGKMLRNFVQIIRSGRVGRRSLGSLPKPITGPAGVRNTAWTPSPKDDADFGSSTPLDGTREV